MRRALTATGLDEIDDLPAAGRFRLHGQAQVGPVEAVHEYRRRPRKELFENVGSRRGIRRGGESDGLHAAQRGLNGAERRVFRTKIVAPLRDAVRLVDGEQRDLGAREQAERFRLHQAFGRHIDETQFTARDAVEDQTVLGWIVRRVERRGGDAVAAELRDLIAHERNQRRHDDGDAVAKQRRKLVAQRLAASRRHDRENVAAVEDSGDDLALPGAERLEAEGRAKYALRGREVRHMRMSLAPVLSLFPQPRKPSQPRLNAKPPARRIGTS